MSDWYEVWEEEQPLSKTSVLASDANEAASEYAGQRFSELNAQEIRDRIVCVQETEQDVSKFVIQVEFTSIRKELYDNP